MNGSLFLDEPQSGKEPSNHRRNCKELVPARSTSGHTLSQKAMPHNNEETNKRISVSRTECAIFLTGGPVLVYKARPW